MALQKLPSLFKAHSPKQFGFKTRYYDREKEEIKQRIEHSRRTIKAENSLKNSEKENLRDQIHSKWQGQSRKTAINRSNKTILAIVGLLSIFCYYYLFKS